jgi:hypothetical protein
MQEKRNIRLIISLFLLTAATVGVLWMNGRSDVSLDKNIFKLEDSKNIDRIVLESANEKINLKFNGTRWIVNEKYEADRNLVDVLFATIQQAEPKRPVSSLLRDSLSNALERNGVKVSFFGADKQALTFFAGGNPKKTQAYFRKQGDDTPYVMIIPGYRVYTSGIFELGANGWREKRIFNFNWRNFKSLTATFSQTPTQSFKVTFIDRYFGIEGINQIDTTKLNNYLDAVSLLAADAFIENPDSLSQLEPQVTIEVMDVADRRYALSVFPRQVARPSVVGKIEEEQLVTFYPQKITEILRTRDYFIKRE